MNKINWTRRTKSGVAIAVVGAALAGVLAFSGGVSAQTQNPPTATSSPLAGGKFGLGGRGGKGMRFGTPANSPFAVAAKALGIDEATLRTELQSGKTIADLASAKGVALSGIKDAILAAQKADLAQAVTDGKLTQAQADQMLADAPTRIDDLLSGKAPLGGPGGPGGPGGRHGGPMFGTPENSPMAVTAKTLGIDEAALRTELQAGKTIADVAKAKGVDSAKIVSAIVAAQKADLAQAVTDGKLTQAQADQMQANAETRATDLVNGKAPLGGPGGRGGRGGPMIGDPANSPLAVAAKTLGIDETALRTELQSGKTIADVAKAKGVDSAKIVSAIVTARKSDLAQAVTDGKLTQAQADQMSADIETHATDMINGTAPLGGHKGGPNGGRGPGRGFGPGQQAPGNAPATPAVSGDGA